jgi:DNA-binding transcriptional LysR family regulator
MVDTRLLSGVEVPVAVIETSSFFRAAEALGLSHSGVSRAIARLEARLGVRVLERTTRSLRQTDEGGRFYAEAAALVAQLSGAALALTSARQAMYGRLRVEVGSVLLATGSGATG